MEQEIIEGNKLIAEFMGWQWIVPKNAEYEPYYRQVDEEGLPIREKRPDRLLYHTSWDWLMPVFEKIGTLVWQIDIMKKGCMITCFKQDGKMPMHKAHINESGKSLIMVTWRTVVSFIKWYNENKTNF